MKVIWQLMRQMIKNNFTTKKMIVKRLYSMDNFIQFSHLKHVRGDFNI